jgi:glutamate synthase (NADPH/NADH) large chain
MRARQGVMKSPVLGDDLEEALADDLRGPVDTACFDNALELLVMGGYPLAHAAMMMIPEAWAGNHADGRGRRAFYEYHARDGAVGRPGRDRLHRRPQIGATLDRNGLRPGALLVTDDDLVVMASEIGVLPIPRRSSRSGGCSRARCS